MEPKPKRQGTQSISITLSYDSIASVTKIAQTEERSVSQVIDRLIRQFTTPVQATADEGAGK